MNEIKKGLLYGVGTGPGDPELLTIKAVKAIQKADIIFVPKSIEQKSTVLNIVEEYLPKEVVIESLEFSMSLNLETRICSRKQNAKRINDALNLGKNVVFLTIGDPMLYSTYNYILEYVDPKYVKTIPGIYSFSAISSLLSFPLCKGEENLCVVSNFDRISQKIILKADTTVCMKVSSYHRELHQFLKTNSFFQFIMITDVGKSNQKISQSIEDLKQKIPYFTTVIIKKKNKEKQ